jgi:hypothetical protein
MFSDLLNTDNRANVVVVVIVTCDEKEVFEDDDDITFDFKNDDVSIFDFKEHVDVETNERRFVTTTTSTDDVLHRRNDWISR